MAIARRSLSRLFLNKPTAEEAAHQTRLKALAEAAAGKPFVLDDAPLRMMYLTPDCMQSAMRIDQPHQLLCAYSRAMMGFLLFNPHPKHVVLIGLGGGSLVKYCYQHLPDCRITAIDINADVIAMRQQFMIPDDDERLSIIHADAVEWLPRQRCDADVIFLDAYDTHGLVPALNSAEFYANCHHQLNQRGVLVANVWGKPSVIAPMLSSLRRQFAKQVSWMKSYDSYNLIVYACKNQSIEMTDVPGSHAKQIGIKLNAGLPSEYWSANLHSVKVPDREDDIPVLVANLRSILISDPNVPQNYADWRSHVLQSS